MHDDKLELTHESITISTISWKQVFKEEVEPTAAAGVALTTCGGIPVTGTAPLGGRFLLVTDAQENGCRKDRSKDTRES